MNGNSRDRQASGVAAVLSFLWPGLGHIYLGYPVLGIAVATLTGVATIVAYQILTSWRVQLFGASGLGDQEKVIVGIVLVGGTVVWLAAILHSLHLAKRTGAIGPGTAKASVAPSDIGEETWQAISRSDNRDLFSEFIERFPDHPRVMLARLRLDGPDIERGPPTTPVPSMTPRQARHGSRQTTLSRTVSILAIVAASVVVGVYLYTGSWPNQWPYFFGWTKDAARNTERLPAVVSTEAAPQNAQRQNAPEAGISNLDSIDHLVGLNIDGETRIFTIRPGAILSEIVSSSGRTVSLNAICREGCRLSLLSKDNPSQSKRFRLSEAVAISIRGKRLFVRRDEAAERELMPE